jgi:hypothetical protein
MGPFLPIGFWRSSFPKRNVIRSDFDFCAASSQIRGYDFKTFFDGFAERAGRAVGLNF